MRSAIQLIAVLLLLDLNSHATAASMMDDFIDPQDGMFDVSHWLAERKGFFPIPIIITEPAVGFGLGAGLLFLHDPLAGKTADGETFDPQNIDHKGRLIPPSVSGLFGAYTENESWLVGGAHMGVWRNDRIRYTGALAQASLNLKFFGLDGGNGPASNGLQFNIRPTILLQELKFRLKESDFFAGINYLLLDSNIEFDLSGLLPIEIPSEKFDSRSASVSLLLDYDSRDTLFTPGDGLSAGIKASFYREAFGSDDEFEKYKAYAKFFTPLSDTLVLGLRGEADTLNGEAPFYEYPFINLRGIPAMRYQGETVTVGEAEFRWNFVSRWSLILFGGAGRAQSIDTLTAADDTVFTKGLGFRYFIARRFGAHAGVDVAKGPEDTVVYLTFGQAWY
ncbi:MAG: BamA/TamA family outer membrane protein [Gammaproteobacteria bacterium]|nr:BamA/TamA family outer membrane protein [Gammaproteobacteria bacterium]